MITHIYFIFINIPLVFQPHLLADLPRVLRFFVRNCLVLTSFTVVKPNEVGCEGTTGRCFVQPVWWFEGDLRGSSRLLPVCFRDLHVLHELISDTYKLRERYRKYRIQC